MSQKLQIYRNNNSRSEQFGKFYVRPVYDDKCITTDELAGFIQSQCTVRRSDCKAVLDELGSAMKHFFEQGRKIRLDNIGTFRVGVRSVPSSTLQACTAGNVRQAHVVFSPQTESVRSGESKTVTRAVVKDGQAVAVEYRQSVYTYPVTMLKDVEFELSKDSVGKVS